MRSSCLTGNLYSMCNSITFNQIQFSLTHTHTHICVYVCVCVCYLGEVLCPAACLPELPCHSTLNAHYFAHFIILSRCRVCAECVCECVCVRAEVSLYSAATSLLLSLPLSLVQLLFECIAHSNALFENLLNTFCQGERFALCLPSAKKGCGTSCQIK